MLLRLFWSFIKIGLFSFGGGLASLPLIKSEMVDLHGWLTMSEFTDLITIAEMTPGPIALNAATFVGTTLSGWAGAVIATFGFVLPSVILVSILSLLYRRYKNLTVVQGVLSGLRPAVVALIGTAGLSILLLALFGESFRLFLPATMPGVDLIAIGLFLLGFIILRRFKPNPVFVILGSGLIGGVLYIFL